MSDAAWPSISVVMPSYNYGRYIERAVLSALRQDYAGQVQIIVSDGGSTDETVEVLKKFGGAITWWSERDKGFIDAVQKAMRRATGDLVVILSADDYFLPGAFQAAARASRAHPAAGFVVGWEIVVNEDGMAEYCYRGRGPVTPESILFQELPAQNATFFRRECYEQVGGLRRLSDNDTAADIDLWYRIAHFNPGVYIEQVLSVYLNHSAQMTRGLNPFHENLVRMVEQCAADPQYSARFRLDPARQRSLYVYWELFWTNRTHAGKAKARELAARYAGEAGELDERARALIAALTAPGKQRAGGGKRKLGRHLGRTLRRWLGIPRHRPASALHELGPIDFDWWNR